MYNFRIRLAERQRLAKTLLCVGLDPDIKELPYSIQEQIAKLDNDEEKAIIVGNHMQNIVDATAIFACMYKPQIAHWEALGTTGLMELTRLICYIKQTYPEIPVFLDCKRGDIDNTQEMYRIASFEKYRADGMNFNPYMGRSCMKALYDENNPGRALVGLCFTSNPDARETQDALMADGDMYWQFIAKKTLKWAEELGPGVLNNAGLVMAAAYADKDNPGVIHKEHLVSCRQIVHNKFWFLIPGIGKQGGLLTETIESAYFGPGSIAVNESRSIIFASKGDDYLFAAANAAANSSLKMRQTVDSF